MSGARTARAERALIGAAAPSSALLLPQLTGQAPAALVALGRRAVASLAALPDVAAVVLLVAGTPDSGTRLHTGEATLAGLGLAGIGAVLAPDGAPHVASLAAALGADRAAGEHAPVDGTVLAALLQAGGRTTPPILVALDPGAAGAEHVALGSALARWAAGRPAGSVLVLAAGDLAAAHGPAAPLPGRQGAAALDAALAGGLAGLDAAALATLGPAPAGRLGARGWAPLTALAAALRLVDMPAPVCEVHRPRGVTYLLAVPAT